MDDADTPALYGRVAGRFGELLEQCPAGSWEAPSPCPGWTARDVAAHVVTNHRRALAGLEDGPFAPPEPGDDLLAAWRDASEGVLRALRDPDRAARPMPAEFDGYTFTAFVRRMACADTLIHTWDLARATGQDERLDGEAVAVATHMLLPEDADIRMPHAYGAAVSPEAGADAQTRLLNFLGRQV